MENLQGGTLALDHYYHVDERLRSFGLVTTYAATQDPFDHLVRVTVYEGLVDAGADPELSDCIGDAAHRASRLDGDGLLAVADFGEIERGVPFVIERTVDGPTLADLMDAQEVFAPADVADLVGRLADVLHRAHNQGVFHGDLRPDWVIFDGDGTDFSNAWLSHFGLSPSMRQLVNLSQTVLTTDLVDTFPPEAFEHVGDQSNDDDGDRQTGASTGSPPHLTADADQWALAALAYRLLVGVHPFFDDPVDASDGIVRIKTESPPSLTELGVETPVADVIDRGLSPDPDDRWPSITDFARALRRAVDGPDDTSEPSSEPPGEQPDRESFTTDTEPDASAVEDQFDSSGQAPPAGPRPSGYLLTAAVAALVLTNLGWFFVTMADDPDEEAATDEQTAAADRPTALPSGLQIRTEPDGVELTVVDPDSDDELLGATPYAIPDSLLDPRIDLLLRHDEFHDQQLAIEQTDTGKDVVVQMLRPVDSD